MKRFEFLSTTRLNNIVHIFTSYAYKNEFILTAYELGFAQQLYGIEPSIETATYHIQRIEEHFKHVYRPKSISDTPEIYAKLLIRAAALFDFGKAMRMSESVRTALCTRFSPKELRDNFCLEFTADGQCTIYWSATIRGFVIGKPTTSK